MSSLIGQQKWASIAVLTVILLLGAFLRLHHVDRHTISHPEVYTPGIDLPWEALKSSSSIQPLANFSWKHRRRAPSSCVLRLNARLD